MFKNDKGDDLPAVIDVGLSDFHKYKGDWLLWRALGKFDGNGNWTAPLSFMEALELPKAMLDTFLELDSIFAKMQRQRAKKQGRK